MTAGLQSVLERSWREDHLLSVLVELTHGCNLKCAFCSSEGHAPGKPLSAAQYLAFFADLREMGVLNLTFSGGEPLLSPVFFEVGAAAREMGFVVRVKSNAYALDARLARRLKDDVDPYQVETSLHGATAATHDRQTRVPGSFERLLANVPGMKAAGLRVKLSAVLTKWNEGEVTAMFAVADRLGVPFRFDPEVTRRGSGARSPVLLAASREGLLRLFREQFARDRAAAPAAGAIGPAVATRPLDHVGAPAPDTGGKHCGAGSTGIAVDPYGVVYPCVQWRRPCGCLHERSIGEIWASSTGLRAVRELQPEIHRRVAEYGPDAGFLAFCPGTAEATSGDPLRFYGVSLRRAELVRHVLFEEEGTFRG
jgi:MoaA/NifB/PqqE/SkfB family radical SAM enzyme